MKLASLIGRRANRRRLQELVSAHREMIRREASIGGTLFGPVPRSVRREFFCLNRETWMWHEEWVDSRNVWHMQTTRYDVRPNGVFKMQDGQPYQQISAQEASHLRTAALMYHKHIRDNLYT